MLALVHELLKADRIDLDFLVRYTNAPWLVIDAPGTAGHGLFARDDGGNPLCVDKAGAVAQRAGGGRRAAPGRRGHAAAMGARRGRCSS